MKFTAVEGMASLASADSVSDFYFVSVDDSKSKKKDIVMTFRNIIFLNLGALKARSGNITIDNCIFKSFDYAFAALAIFNDNERLPGNTKIDIRNTRVYGLQGLLHVQAANYMSILLIAIQFPGPETFLMFLEYRFCETVDFGLLFVTQCSGTCLRLLQCQIQMITPILLHW